MTEELRKEAEEYTKNLLKKLGIKEDMLLENQPKYLRQESMNFVALDVENVTDAYFASAEPREKRIAELEAQIEKMKCCSNCNHFNKESDIEYCQNCERQLVNSLDNFPLEEIIKDEWELRR